MKVVVFTHPSFLESQSMPRFAQMIVQGMLKRGYVVDVWSPTPFFYKISRVNSIRKWLGYLDQYVVFPIQTKVRLNRTPVDTVFVFSDQALGPWVPLIANRPHVVHVHDFMALRSALGEFFQNRTGWSGRLYQAFIKRGFGHGKVFVSASDKTRSDLHRFLSNTPSFSEVVYHGFNFSFRRLAKINCEALLSKAGILIPETGFLLHVGGNQWYKNRAGVLEIYRAYVRQAENPLPLWMVGALPTEALSLIARSIESPGEVRFIDNFSDEQVCAAYSSASLLIFPSLAEGFGWPISESMACGCPVLTTGEAPMTEVGGENAYYIPRQPDGEIGDWAIQSASKVLEILSLPLDEKLRVQNFGFIHIMQFDEKKTLDAYEDIYLKTIKNIASAN